MPCLRSFGLTRSWAHKVGLQKQVQQQRQREASAGIDPHNNRLTRSAMTPQQTLVRSPSTLRCGLLRFFARSHGVPKSLGFISIRSGHDDQHFA